ncbi:hypothetical protein ATI61_116129 [Archangium gephyra]|uniref:DUF4157 domain-containing protein n=1 Tax=Archangium gephyra TaxID=48 RepID=A0AAC8Q9Z9_9BACT|nr:hypothetical protein [Archangium gephyra]AKJ03880.1 Hypothetical protein AA314_05506 [Archangium gephyra]REG23659.1 hypothetical protein ATI61_116129 [Archangium gephyra]
MGTRSALLASSTPGALAPGTTPEVTGRWTPPLLLAGLVSAGLGVLRNLWWAVKCFARGLGRLLTGKFSTGGQELRRGVLKLVQLPLDVLLSLGGRVLSGIQTLVGIEPVGSRLAPRQIAELRKVFGDSLDYERVRLKVGRLGLLSLAGRPFVLGHTLYVPRDIPRTDAAALQLPMHLLIQEMGHIWQYQAGGTDYVCETLWSPWFGEGSDWRTALDAGRSWGELDPEQQVRLLKVAYARSGYFEAPGQRFVDEDTGVDYTGQLARALEQLRTRKGAP